MINFKDIVVLCDKPTDAKLFKVWKKHSTVLNNIVNIDVLPSLESLPAAYKDGMSPLLEFDRADYYFCYQGKPFLVVEMTEHGYTGDNCLQRFARIARTAQLRIPFIYFAPFSRTRYDELYRTNPSYRNVSSNLYKGFIRLMEIYDTPVIAMEWNTNDKGIPMILGIQDPVDTGLDNLIKLLEVLLSKYIEQMVNKVSILNKPELSPHIALTSTLSKRENVTESEVKIEGLSYSNVLEIIINPRKSYKYVPREYFMKGKAHKLITLMCIEHSNIDKLVLPNDEIVKFNSIEELQKLLPCDFSKKPWLFYHSGYQWRAEPNVGIVTNLDITVCRSKKGLDVKSRDSLLVVHWPRIFFNKNSEMRGKLLNILNHHSMDSYFQSLIKDREKSGGSPDGERFIECSDKAIGSWREKATVARIFRNTCDLTILNDAIILGNMWRDEI